MIQALVKGSMYDANPRERARSHVQATLTIIAFAVFATIYTALILGLISLFF